ncbi:MAG: phage shock protein B [Paraglaciecola psychrophila]|jgi:phage shock protein B
MKMLEFLFVPTILFLTVVAPIWIGMHYSSSRKSSRSLDQGDREELEHLLADLDKMTERITTLEAILDQEHGDWRARAPAEDTVVRGQKRSATHD